MEHCFLLAELPFWKREREVLVRAAVYVQNQQPRVWSLIVGAL